MSLFARPRRPSLRRRRLRTPIIPQLEAAECGAASLGIILAHLGRWVSLEKLRDACGVSRDGSNAADILRAGERYGLRIRGWRKTVESLDEVTIEDAWRAVRQADLGRRLRRVVDHRWSLPPLSRAPTRLSPGGVRRRGGGARRR